MPPKGSKVSAAQRTSATASAMSLAKTSMMPADYDLDLLPGLHNQDGWHHTGRGRDPVPADGFVGGRGSHSKEAESRAHVSPQPRRDGMQWDSEMVGQSLPPAALGMVSSALGHSPVTAAARG
jgi:hypothetical protein